MDPRLEVDGRIASCQISGELDVGAGTGLRSKILQLEELVEQEIKTARSRVEQLRYGN